MTEGVKAPWLWANRLYFGARVADLLTPQAEELGLVAREWEEIRRIAVQILGCIAEALYCMGRNGENPWYLTATPESDLHRMFKVIAPGTLPAEGTAARVVHDRIAGNPDRLCLRFYFDEESGVYRLQLVPPQE